MDFLTDLLFGLEPIQAVQSFFGLGHTVPFRAISMLGDTWGVLLAVGIGFWLFGRRALYGLVGITVFAAGTWTVVSGLFDVSRPEGAGIVVYDHLDFGAFPSGHVTQAAVTWGLLYAMGSVPLAVPILAAALTGLGRIYLGAHFLGDVLGGLVYAALVVAAFFFAWRRLQPWLEDRSAVFFRVAAGIAFVGGLVWLTQLPAEASARRMEVVALIIAAAVALPAEHRWVRYSPGDSTGGRRAAKVAVGVAGLALLFLAEQLMAPRMAWAAPLSVGLAAAWAILVAPALFQRLGWTAETPTHVTQTPGAP